MDKIRFNLISQIVKNKRVLDVGCVDHEANKEQSKEWLHRIIVDEGKEVTGLDLEEEQVRKLRSRGYNIICGDAEVINLGKQFEVIVAGELIEHLDNPGRFLRNMRKHLEPNGTIVLTTPNPFYPKRFLEIITNKSVVVHPQHVSWFCPSTLYSILNRTGYSDIEIIPFNNSERHKKFISTLTNYRPWFSTNLLVCAKNPE